MKNLMFLSSLFLVLACSKNDSLLYNLDIEKEDRIVFSSRASKPKKGNFVGHLSSDQTNAIGQVNFKFAGDNSSVYFKLIVANIEDVHGAHLHHAHMGNTPGHAVLPLFTGLINGSSNGILSEGTLTNADIICGCGDPDHHSLARIRIHIEDGETSVIVHTANFPDGEMHGVIH